jgi:hypothetical protein
MIFHFLAKKIHPTNGKLMLLKETNQQNSKSKNFLSETKFLILERISSFPFFFLRKDKTCDDGIEYIEG